MIGGGGSVVSESVTVPVGEGIQKVEGGCGGLNVAGSSRCVTAGSAGSVVRSGAGIVGSVGTVDSVDCITASELAGTFVIDGAVVLVVFVVLACFFG